MIDGRQQQRHDRRVQVLAGDQVCGGGEQVDVVVGQVAGQVDHPARHSRREIGEVPGVGLMAFEAQQLDTVRGLGGEQLGDDRRIGGGDEKAASIFPAFSASAAARPPRGSK